MSKLRRVLTLLFMSLLLLAAVPASAEELTKDTCTEASVRKIEQTESSYIERWLSVLTCTVDKEVWTAGRVYDRIFTVVDGVRYFDRMERHFLSDVTVTVAPNLGKAEFTANLEGVPVSGTLAATGHAETSVLHPGARDTYFDGYDGVQADIVFEQGREAAVTLTWGTTTEQATGGIFKSQWKTESNEGQEPKEHQPYPGWAN